MGDTRDSLVRPPGGQDESSGGALSDARRGASDWQRLPSRATVCLVAVVAIGCIVARHEVRLARLEAASGAGGMRRPSDALAEAGAGNRDAGAADSVTTHHWPASYHEAGAGISADALGPGSFQNNKKPRRSALGERPAAGPDRRRAPRTGRRLQQLPPAVTRYEAETVSATSALSDDQSRGVALHVEEPGAAILMSAPTKPGHFEADGTTSSVTEGDPGRELLLFPTEVISPVTTKQAEQPSQRLVNAETPGSCRILRSPLCKSLLSEQRCRDIGASEPSGATCGGQAGTPGLVVAGDLVVLGRVMSQTVDALQEDVTSQNETASALEARTKALERNVSRLRAESDLAGVRAEMAWMASEAASRNAQCPTVFGVDASKMRRFKFNELGWRSEVSDLPDGSCLNDNGVTADIIRDSGLPMSALSGVPNAWGSVNADGIRAHAAVTVVIPRAAAFGGHDRPRKYAWLYVTGGLKSEPYQQGNAMAHAFRLDMISLRWEMLPHLPEARGFHSMAWMPALGAVLVGPGLAGYRQGSPAVPFFGSSPNNTLVHALAVPEALWPDVEWSRPTKLSSDGCKAAKDSGQDLLYSHEEPPKAGQGWKQHLPSSHRPVSLPFGIRPDAWTPVAELSTALFDYSLAVFGTRLVVYGGTTSVNNPSRAVLSADLGHPPQTSRVTMLELCSWNRSQAFPLGRGAALPVRTSDGTAADRLTLVAGKEDSSSTVLDVSGSIKPAVLTLPKKAAPEGAAACDFSFDGEVRDAWTGFGAVQLSSGDVLATGGRRNDWTNTKAYRFPANLTRAAQPITGGSPDNGDTAELADLTHSDWHSSYVLGALSSVPEVPVAPPARWRSKPWNPTLLALANATTAQQLLPSDPWTPSAEVWWFGGDDTRYSSVTQNRLTASDSAILRRVGGDLWCGELGAARRHAVSLSQPPPA